MVRRKTRFGPNLSRILEAAPPTLVSEFLARRNRPDHSLLNPPDIDADRPEFEARAALTDFLEDQDDEILRELNRICSAILDMADGKGATSLQTVVGKKLLNIDFDVFDAQNDALCKSIWVHNYHPGVFQDAESFFAVRRYREHRKLYAAYQVDLDDLLAIDAEDIDLHRLCRKLEAVLGLKARASASAIDLPPTEDYPPSTMVALRHPGPLSSIQDHREDGGWSTYYYRPSNEAVLIYTPAQKKIEICAESFDVRDKTTTLFAEIVLGQNLSERPLTRRNYNLERFRQSFRLDCPDYDDVEIRDATVIEAEMPLGTWARRLSLKVTKEEDIEAVFETFLVSATHRIRSFGFSRVVIAVTYALRRDGKPATLRITVYDGNRSDVQNQNDPFRRDLGFRLLSNWGLCDKVRPPTEAEKALWFRFLLSLYDLAENEVSGAFFAGAGVEPDALRNLGFVERKRRQAVILIDEEADAVEGDLLPGASAGSVRVNGGFGEEIGARPETEALIYQVDRKWLAETILKGVSDALDLREIEVVDDHLSVLGRLKIGERSVPTYLARGLTDLKTRDRLELELRRRHGSGVGIVFTTSPDAPPYLGPNVVIELGGLLTSDESIVVLDQDEITRRFDAGRSLVASCQTAQVIRHANQAATLILPGAEPLSLGAANQIRIFERLVDAANNGSREIRTPMLMEGMSSDHPQQAFPKDKWKLINGVYLSHGSSNRFWCLGKQVE